MKRFQVKRQFFAQRIRNISRKTKKGLPCFIQSPIFFNFQLPVTKTICTQIAHSLLPTFLMWLRDSRLKSLFPQFSLPFPFLPSSGCPRALWFNSPGKQGLSALTISLRMTAQRRWDASSQTFRMQLCAPSATIRGEKAKREMRVTDWLSSVLTSMSLTAVPWCRKPVQISLSSLIRQTTISHF